MRGRGDARMRASGGLKPFFRKKVLRIPKTLKQGLDNFLFITNKS